jgi:hypothetical protein
MAMPLLANNTAYTVFELSVDTNLYWFGICPIRGATLIDSTGPILLNPFMDFRRDSEPLQK